MAALSSASTPMFTTEMQPLPLGEGFEEEVNTALDKVFPMVCGHDSEGGSYSSITDLWGQERQRAYVDAGDEAADAMEEGGEEEGGGRATAGGVDTGASGTTGGPARAVNKCPAWYDNALHYWDKCPPTVDGVLGGYGVLTTADVIGSTVFLADLRKLRPTLGSSTAVDCGAGIGRVAKHFLLPNFDEVHLLEQSPPLIAAAPKYLGKKDLARSKLLCMGMQSFDPPPRSYDVVWVQWVIGHLTDADLVTFLRRCVAALKPGGVICVKDNTYNGDTKEDGTEELFFVDRDDSSVTRSHKYMEAIFEYAGMEVALSREQEGFPEELFPVPMYALVSAENPEHA